MRPDSARIIALLATTTNQSMSPADKLINYANIGAEGEFVDPTIAQQLFHVQVSLAMQQVAWVFSVYLGLVEHHPELLPELMAEASRRAKSSPPGSINDLTNNAHAGFLAMAALSELPLEIQGHKLAALSKIIWDKYKASFKLYAETLEVSVEDLAPRTVN